MISKKYYFENMDISYYVGIGKFAINYEEYLMNNNLKDDKSALNHFFSEIESIQEKFEGSTIQLIKDKYLINQEHVFTACYYVQKAFFYQSNIANSKNLELLLYLSANRQIKNGIDAFGIGTGELKSNNLMYCIMVLHNNLLEIKDYILNIFNGIEIKSMLFHEDLSSYDSIKKFFQINENQVNVITNSYDISNQKKNIDLKIKFNALYELICEKMAILSLEKTK